MKMQYGKTPKQRVVAERSCAWFFMQETLNVADILSDSIIIIVYVALLSAGVAQPISLCSVGSCSGRILCEYNEVAGSTYYFEIFSCFRLAISIFIILNYDSETATQPSQGQWSVA